MQLNDLILVSVDDHLIEPPETFTAHIAPQFKSRAPQVEQRNGRDMWVFEGRPMPQPGLNAVAGRPREEYGMEPLSFAQMRKGCYDIHARIDDMNANGVVGSLCFPSLASFAGTTLLSFDDKELVLAVIRAYNDWHVHDWCGAYPGRFIPTIILPLWDPNLCAEEVRRFTDYGVHSISFPDNPPHVGLPTLHSDAWNPLWEACSDNKVVISAHIGSGAVPPHAGLDTPIDAWITTFPMSIALAAADWLHAPVWSRFPDLRIALSEGGIGWIPYFLERADFTHEHHHKWTNADFGGKKPSDIFKKHFITCFIEDIHGIKNLQALGGSHMVTWECDYPHSDSMWPESPEYLLKCLPDIGDATIDALTHLNAMREYSFDPFSILGKENCTVGALRERARHVDVSPVSDLGGARPVDDDLKRPVTSGDVMRMLQSA